MNCSTECHFVYAFNLNLPFHQKAPVANPCEPNPCQNGGECSVDAEGKFSCACAEGFEGRRCQKETGNH